jgi:nicotinamidase-related amidase
MRFPTARTRRQAPPDSQHFSSVDTPVTWNLNHTALIICDMWDKHWCPAATARVTELAPPMNLAVAAARDRGVLIIHAPSDTMEFYAGTPQRRRAQTATDAGINTEIPGYRHPDEPPLPIDDSDGGCDSENVPAHRAWTCQHPVLDIGENDAISDSGREIFNLLQQESRENILLMGVHTNMCILNRPFAIRRMLALGKSVMLVRDMTDAMYNPAKPPYVSHFEGTRRVIAHIETYLCPTIESSDLTGAVLFRFHDDV